MQKLELKIPPVLLVVISLLLMWLTQQLLPHFAFTSTNHYGVQLAGTLLLLGAFVIFAGVYAFRKAQTTVNPMTPSDASSLVNTGIYRITRNPMYLGFLLMLIAYAVYLQHPFTLIWCGVFVGYMTQFQIKPEERMLNRLFGEPYQDYCTQVRRWI
ncbi:methyltransferase family protein [Thalassotalea euphylliae]|uniref:Isoprenylcysteine carboxylmethyltransferase family protein n=1 Tax=Thalassotalea euphylliae TaxID=1655234 RepID=A0A3E0TXX3_9GAMM|nr:isoprenylcysteine carboxylmethyltransferase family protein [Thalassotalea euphylliae]REL29329.1 isoprenylcysteine carboxylmethyltransferase family protein [Thalassotalea euphylliae]